MEPKQAKKAVTLGELIEGGYRACGKRRAKAIIWLAAKARLIVFEEPGPLYDFFRDTWRRS